MLCNRLQHQSRSKAHYPTLELSRKALLGGKPCSDVPRFVIPHNHMPAHDMSRPQYGMSLMGSEPQRPSRRAGCPECSHSLPTIAKIAPSMRQSGTSECNLRTAKNGALWFSNGRVTEPIACDTCAVRSHHGSQLHCCCLVGRAKPQRSGPTNRERISPKSGSVQNKKWIRSKKSHQTTARFVKVL